MLFDLVLMLFTLLVPFLKALWLFLSHCTWDLLLNLLWKSPMSSHVVTPQFPCFSLPYFPWLLRERFHVSDHVNLTSTDPASLTPSNPVNYTWTQCLLLLMIMWFSSKQNPFPPSPLALRAPPSWTPIQWHYNLHNPDPTLMAALLCPLLSQETPFLYSYILSMPMYFLPVFLFLRHNLFISFNNHSA